MNTSNLKFTRTVLGYLQRGDRFAFANGQLIYVYEGMQNGQHIYTELESYRSGRRGAYSAKPNAIVDMVDESGF